MAKAGLLYVGTDDGIVLYSEPGAAGRWLRVGQELRGAAVGSVWVWPESPLTVVARAGASLRRSADGGASWAEVSGAPAGALAGGKVSGAQLWSLADDGSVWWSGDAGEGWERVGQLAGGTGGLLAAASDSAGTLLAASGARVWVSRDAGRSWEGQGDLPTAAAGLLVTAGGMWAAAGGRLYQADGAGWRAVATPGEAAGALAVLPGREPTLLAALGVGVGRSPDGGTSWEVAGEDAGWGGAPAALAVAPYHMDIALAVGGPAVALTTDRGRTWQRLRGELPSARSVAVARLD